MKIFHSVAEWKRMKNWTFESFELDDNLQMEKHKTIHLMT